MKSISAGIALSVLCLCPLLGQAQPQSATSCQAAKPSHAKGKGHAAARTSAGISPQIQAILRRSYTLSPADPEAERAKMLVSMKFHDLLLAGDALLARGDTDGAIAQYRVALSVKPDPDAWIKIGDVFWQQGKTQDTIDAYQSAVNVLPASDSVSHEKLGDVYVALERDDEALAEYQTALTRQIDAQDYFKLALLYAKHQQFEQAIQAYNQGLQWMDQREQPVLALSSPLDATNQSAFAAAAHVALGLIRTGHGYFDEAIAEERTALRLQPDSATAHYYLAQCLVNKGGSLPEARSEYHKAQQLDHGQIKSMAEKELNFIGR